jgi:predicted double-glycine peptidase
MVYPVLDSSALPDPTGKEGSVVTQFRLLKQTRQMTEYSCGASALQSVLSYWGKQVEENALMRLLGTNAEVGTFPEDMVRAARALGFDAEVKENATLDELQQFTADGRPVALGQLWRSEKDTPASAADEWDCGHYIVVLAVDRDHVYFQDPYIRMGKGFVPRKTFEAHWHQIMGGSTLARSPKLMRVAIFVSGKEPARPASGADAESPKIQFGHMGSMNVVSIHFRRCLLPFDFLDEFRAFDDIGVRAVAFVLLRKDAEGLVSAMQGGRIGDSLEVMQVNALIGALAARALRGPGDVRIHAQSAARAAAAGDFGLSAGDLKLRADRLPPDTSEVIILFENTWEVRLREIAERHDGKVAQQRTIQSTEMAEFARELSDIRPQ